MTYILRFGFSASHNESKYEALIVRLQLVIKMSCEHIHAFIDSMVVTNQTNELYEIRGKILAQHAEKVKTLTKQFGILKLEHVPRSKNKRSDALRKLAF